MPLGRRHRSDELLNAWRFAQTEAHIALCAWTDCALSAKPDAFATYCAALDREEQAAAVLAGVSDASHRDVSSASLRPYD